VQELYDATKVKNGVFQAMMEVGLVNDGPVGANTDPPVPFIDYDSNDGAVIRIFIVNIQSYMTALICG
jgi:D-tyrosyl-tRNA(Tyr) deacylase